MPQFDRQAFGQRLRLLRDYREMTQQQVANFLNVDRSTYSYYENGKTEPSITVLMRMAELFSVTLDNLECCTVLAYMPGIKSEFDTGYEKLETLYPDGLEKVPKRFAIDWRNKWMVQQSDYVISYVCHSFGGAAKYMELAKRKKKIVYNLANL